MANPTIQEIKQAFFLLRNGIIADKLRTAEPAYRIVWGLTLPQIADVASTITPDAVLARSLWADAGLRECVLLAPMVMPRDEMTLDEARRWIDTAPTSEAVDILCHKLLRHIPNVQVILEPLSIAHPTLTRYAALRLAVNLQLCPPFVDEMAHDEEPMLRRLARQILDDRDFYLQNP